MQRETVTRILVPARTLSVLHPVLDEIYEPETAVLVLPLGLQRHLCSLQAGSAGP